MFSFLSSMGGTDPNNFLNKVGKKPDGSGNGDILLWKRKAERYLVDVSKRPVLPHACACGMGDTTEASLFSSHNDVSFFRAELITQSFIQVVWSIRILTLKNLFWM